MTPRASRRGYHSINVNGEAIFEDGHETGAVPGCLLRHGG
jgi:hypothetical protein